MALGQPVGKNLKIAVLTDGYPSEADGAVARALVENEYQTALIDPNTPFPGDRDPDLYVITGPYHSLAETIRRLERSPDIPVICWYTEPLPPLTWPRSLAAGLADMRFRVDPLFRLNKVPKVPGIGRLRACGEVRYLHKTGRLKLLATYTEHDARFFQDLGLPAVALPMGYTPSFGRDLALPRDIDVIFIGSTRDKRRGPIIRELQRGFEERGVRMVIKDGSKEHGYAYGKERTMLLNRSKIALSIMRQPWDTLVYRTLVAAPNKAMVLSEPVIDPGPFVPGEHFAEAEIAALPDAIQHYLDHEAERERIAANAHQLVTEELMMERMAEQLVATWLESG